MTESERKATAIEIGQSGAACAIRDIGGFTMESHGITFDGMAMMRVHVVSIAQEHGVCPMAAMAVFDATIASHFQESSTRHEHVPCDMAA